MAKKEKRNDSQAEDNHSKDESSLPQLEEQTTTEFLLEVVGFRSGDSEATRQMQEAIAKEEGKLHKENKMEKAPLPALDSSNTTVVLPGAIPSRASMVRKSTSSSGGGLDNSDAIHSPSIRRVIQERSTSTASENASDNGKSNHNRIGGSHHSIAKTAPPVETASVIIPGAIPSKASMVFRKSTSSCNSNGMDNSDAIHSPSIRRAIQERSAAGATTVAACGGSVSPSFRDNHYAVAAAEDSILRKNLQHDSNDTNIESTAITSTSTSGRPASSNPGAYSVTPTPATTTTNPHNNQLTEDFNDDTTDDLSGEQYEVDVTDHPHQSHYQRSTNTRTTTTTTSFPNARMETATTNASSTTMDYRSVLSGVASSAYSGLSVADLVAPSRDFSIKELPHAEAIQEGEEMDNSKTKAFKSKQRKEKTRYYVVLLIIVAVMIAVGILLGVFLPQQQKDGGGSTSSGNDNQHHQQQLRAPQPPSASPSQAPTSFEDQVLSLLPEESVRSVVEDPMSPQSQAMEWLLRGEDMQSARLDSNMMMSSDRILQRFALATLFKSTLGESWVRNDGWLNHSVHECEWFMRPDFALKNTIGAAYPGYLREFDYLPSSSCNELGLYEHLWLDQNGLHGMIPEEIYLLTHLKTLSFGLNQLEGTISTRIGELSLLEALGFWGLRMGGTIPSEIGLLSGLGGIGFSDNEHVGSLPTELWQLTNLTTILVHRNPHLGGTIPTSIPNLSRLRWFTMSECNFTGQIPTQMGELKYLEWFNFAGSNFSGTIPSQLGNLPEALLMTLEMNSLQGSIPSELGHLTSPTLLSLHSNQLSGELPSEFGLLSSLSLGLNLHNNEFLNGTIPSELGNLINLQKLSLQNNRLTGRIPSELGLMAAAGSLDFGGNSFSGTLPNELAVLQKTFFDFNVAGNPELAGTVPQALCNITMTCQQSSLNPILLPCEGMDGLSFDCTSKLCGCSCPCQDVLEYNQSMTDAAAQTNETIG